MKVIPKSSQVPRPRGPMMNAETVAADLFYGQVTPKWVLAHVPGKMKFGHRTALFYRDDVLAFIESQRESAA